MNEQQFLEEHKEERTKCEVWTRVMGYHRPKESFNAGKVSEFNERKMFKESIACSAKEMEAA